jgi:hypothetical protein
MRGVPGGLTRPEASKEVEMQGKVHRHVALVATKGAEAAPRAHAVAAPRPLANGISLLRLSVPARLAMVAIAVALLWGAVLWALA